jgi:glycosyltransferase involved in cell wall biosynthesis
MISWLKRCAMQGEDRLRYSPQVRHWLSELQLWRASRRAPSDNQARARSIHHLCTAVRLATDEGTVRTGMARIGQHLGALDPAGVDWSEFQPETSRRIGRAAILKPYVSEREKGVLFISFENEWLKLLRFGVLRDVAHRYALVLAPSGSPHNLVSYVFPQALSGPVFTLLSHAEEQRLFGRIAPQYVVVPLFASSWVNPDIFEPLPRARRDLDLVMVANFARFKRHFALFKALRTMPPHLRILLIGQDEGRRNAETVLAAARSYGVADRFTLVRNAPWQSVADALCRARASAILSRREGSCVVVAESLFADTPVALLHDAEVGSRAFINAQTGRLLRESSLASQLTAFIAQADRYSPRRWAQEHISCQASSWVLNDVVRQVLWADGQDWTRDLAILCWRPDPYLVHSEDRAMMRAERDDFRARFGLELGPPVID